MGALISALATFLSGASVAKFIATKAVLAFLFVVILPIILWNVSMEIAQAVFDWVFAALPLPPAIQSFTGMAGWFLVTMQIPQAISVVVSSLAGRFVISSALRLL
ncbi:hypothetical protein [Methylomonas rivi]|uniref:DUF2523 domain-containing protein n=1 Tax=Methylomonas rivi TaxID=2952226 RepID=A0ABT1UAC7_9GAMM|nr:hypothetical protein [Methylomonas sp. WSC-6]MCQ8130823.1 hypothetical protein [Methylomonas sp. WSC-6]